jgi:hypothetical protein
MHLIIFFEEQRKIYIGGSISLAKHLDIWAKTMNWAMVPRWYFGKNIWLGAMLFRSKQKDCSPQLRMLLEATPANGRSYRTIMDLFKFKLTFYLFLGRRIVLRLSGDPYFILVHSCYEDGNKSYF